jgi:hypothetical protein
LGEKKCSQIPLLTDNYCKPSNYASLNLPWFLLSVYCSFLK